MTQVNIRKRMTIQQGIGYWGWKCCKTRSQTAGFGHPAWRIFCRRCL